MNNIKKEIDIKLKLQICQKNLKHKKRINIKIIYNKVQ